MTVSKTDSLPIRSSTDIVLIRQEVRKWSGELGVQSGRPNENDHRRQ